MTRPLFLTMSLICAMSSASCAGFAPPSAPTQVTPPRRELPATARASCPIPPLGPDPVLKLVIAAAAAEILRCDVARQTAVDVHDGEHADEDAWLEELK